MSQFVVNLLTRNFVVPKSAPQVTYNPTSFSWRTMGGCHQASIEASGYEGDIWSLMNWLRSPVIIQDALGQNAWWGFVNEVTIKFPGMTVGVSLEGMANRMQVIYTFEGATGTVSQRTAWASDATSVAVYGTIELIASQSHSDIDRAEAARATLIAQHKYPLPKVEFSRASGKTEAATATISCLGWWHSLRFQYYLNSGDAHVEATTQIAAIVAASGQFITGTQVDDVSGLTPSERRDGRSSALTEVESLLAGGTINVRRLIAEVLTSRILRVWEEPLPVDATIHFLHPDGMIYSPWDYPLLKHLSPVGKWVRIKDMFPGSVSLRYLADPTLAFVDEAEYSVGEDSLRLTMRDVSRSYNVGGLE